MNELFNNTPKPKPKVIPESHIEVEIDSTGPGISKSDLTLISSMHHFFEAQGVVDRATEFNGAETVEEVNEILSEAFEVSKSEEELNPEFYDPKVMQLLDDYEGAPNFMLDEFEDYDI